jgi:hypothetical protein
MPDRHDQACAFCFGSMSSDRLVAKNIEMNRKNVAMAGTEAFLGAGFFNFEIGFPSPPRDRCPNEVVRLRETWSRKGIEDRIFNHEITETHEKESGENDLCQK